MVIQMKDEVSAMKAAREQSGKPSQDETLPAPSPPSETAPAPTTPDPASVRLDILGTMAKLGLESVERPMFPDVRAAKWYQAQVTDVSKTVGIDNVLVYVPVSQPLFWEESERESLGLGAVRAGGLTLVGRLWDELREKENPDPKTPYHNLALFLIFLKKVYVIGAVCSNFDKHGGPASFYSYMQVVITRADHDPTRNIVNADAYMRKHCALQSAAGKCFDFGEEALSVLSEALEAARRKNAPKPKNQKNKGHAKGKGKGKQKGWGPQNEGKSATKGAGSAKP